MEVAGCEERKMEAAVNMLSLVASRVAVYTIVLCMVSLVVTACTAWHAVIGQPFLIPASDVLAWAITPLCGAGVLLFGPQMRRILNLSRRRYYLSLLHGFLSWQTFTAYFGVLYLYGRLDVGVGFLVPVAAAGLVGLGGGVGTALMENWVSRPPSAPSHI